MDYARGDVQAQIDRERKHSTRDVNPGSWLRDRDIDSYDPARLPDANITGLDGDPQVLDIARKKSLGGNVPFPDETFDVVTSSLMMHHLPAHLQVKGVAEILRVLRSPDPASGKPGGRILIADTMRPSGSPFQRFFTSVILHHGHVVESGLQDIPVLLREADYENVEQLDAHFLAIGFVRARKPGI